jgi:hypothetical protein
LPFFAFFCCSFSAVSFVFNKFHDLLQKKGGRVWRVLGIRRTLGRSLQSRFAFNGLRTLECLGSLYSTACALFARSCHALCEPRLLFSSGCGLFIKKKGVLADSKKSLLRPKPQWKRSLSSA